ncbi:leucine-rich repeat domain-containing protein, partial [Leptospira interrogans]
MNFRITLNYLQKISICLFLLTCFIYELQAEESESGTYTDLAKALQNPLKVRTLDLSANRFKTLPKEIGKLKNLQELNLNKNQLTILPKEIGQLKNLRKLNLSANQIKTI